jgi:hypothetical protein
MYTLVPEPSLIHEWIAANPGYSKTQDGSLNWMKEEYEYWVEHTLNPQELFNRFENDFKNKFNPDKKLIAIATYYCGGDVVDSLIRSYEASGRPAFNVFKTSTTPSMSSILNRITSSIKIEAHPHPLYSCFLIRKKNQNGWTCGNCGNNYGITIPSFYCTNCDYSFCQNCLMKYPLYKIRFYDYSTNEDFNVGINQNNSNYYNPNIHKHPLAVIQIENYQNANYVIHCRNCKGDIKLSDSFYYCSLCNFYICGNCFNNSQKVQQLNQKKKFAKYL